MCNLIIATYYYCIINPDYTLNFIVRCKHEENITLTIISFKLLDTRLSVRATSVYNPEANRTNS